MLDPNKIAKTLVDRRNLNEVLPKLAATLAKTAEALHRMRSGGIAAGMLDFKPESARQRFADGFNFIAVGGDTSRVVKGSRVLLGEFGR